MQDRVYENVRERMREYAIHEYRMLRMKCGNPEKYEKIQEIKRFASEVGEVDPKTGREVRLNPEDTPVALTGRLDRLRIIVFRWLVHPERPPAAGRFLAWVAWLVSGSFRAYDAGRWVGMNRWWVGMNEQLTKTHRVRYRPRRGARGSSNATAKKSKG